MLTCRENEILGYTAAGLSAKEIADRISRSEFTVQKIICNVKEKTGLQKATELVAYYFCRKFDLDFAEFRRQVLSAGMVVLVLFASCIMRIEVRLPRHNRFTAASVRGICRGRRNEEYNQINFIRL